MTTTETFVDRPDGAPTFQHLSAGRRARDTLATVLVTAAFLVALVPLVWLLYTVISRGYEAVLSSRWFTHSLSGVMPDQFAGGIYHALYGSIVQGVLCAVIAVPLGVFTAIYLAEYGQGWLARTVTFMVDILSGVPSIVAALFVFALWISVFGLPKSAFAVSLALVLLMLPIVIRSTEEMLRLVPDQLREASYALGVPKWKTIVKIVLPTAFSGMVTGMMLAMARVLGETAPVLVLVGYSRSINYNVVEGNMASLPLTVMNELLNPEPAGVARMWGAALTLVLLVMLFNLMAAVISRLSAVKTE
ncbi:phosphate ABC transporter membrane protein 2, PhoT family [Haloechinothrix alba]|uniref:Phosphate transport system permease protein PstA n=1 Tax=Haloechinothrix alba TaxID=664784 RepID=A0A238W781_9PSEU|nr:phosphate ABC transporter permease PstA [Haloechinothrix alba]SNR42402.1 phosphate ABC transporter membrane protein 2, PhoT family [Haloechinothrix alba]